MIKDNNLNNVLKDSPLFRDLDEKSLLEISQQFRKTQYSKGGFLHNGNKTFRKFYLFASGRLKVYQINAESGKEYTMYILSTGDVFNILTLLDGQVHDIMTEAIDDIDLYYTSVENARNWIKIYPAFNQAMFLYLANRMRKLEQAAIDISLTDTCTRLAKLLLQNLDDDTHELNLVNNLSHTELARMIGTTRAVVNRHLQALKKEGIIDIKRKQLHIKNLKLLKTKIQSYG